MHSASSCGECSLKAVSRTRYFRSYGALAVLVLLILAAALVARSLGLFELSDRTHLANAIRRVQGVKAIGVWFVLAYAVMAGIGLPATALTLAGGAIFGTALGSGLNWTGAVLGATIAHVLARSLGSDGINRLLGRNATKLEAFSERLNFQNILRLRLIPITPFNLLNFACGLARVPLRAYVPATAIGILPGTIIYTFFSDSLIGGVAGAKTHALLRVLVAGVLLTLLSFIPALIRRRSGPGVTVSACLAVGSLFASLTGVPSSAAAQSGLFVHRVTAASATLAPFAKVPFDHSLFDQLLHQHVADGLVDYDAFEKSAEFQRYLGALASAKPETFTRPEQLAFWINAYNAYTIALMNQHHERRSIRNINKTFGLISMKGPWTERMAHVGGDTYTLLHIEDEILRAQFHDPRIHFAIVCASLGCPPLRSEAFTGAALEQQLDDQARAFLLRSPTKNRVDVANRTVFVSPIFGWYRADFGASDAAVGQYIAQFYPAGPARDLLTGGSFTMKETAYDWSINSQRPVQR